MQDPHKKFDGDMEEMEKATLQYDRKEHLGHF
jgi:hypothetical protein